MSLEFLKFQRPDPDDRLPNPLSQLTFRSQTVDARITTLEQASTYLENLEDCLWAVGDQIPLNHPAMRYAKNMQTLIIDSISTIDRADAKELWERQKELVKQFHEWAEVRYPQYYQENSYPLYAEFPTDDMQNEFAATLRTLDRRLFSNLRYEIVQLAADPEATPDAFSRLAELECDARKRAG